MRNEPSTDEIRVLAVGNVCIDPLNIDCIISKCKGISDKPFASIS